MISISQPAAKMYKVCILSEQERIQGQGCPVFWCSVKVLEHYMPEILARSDSFREEVGEASYLEPQPEEVLL